MAINTTTVSANLTTKLNNTSGTTDAKEFLLLGKAVEALTPSVTVQDVIDEGTTQTTAVTTEGTTQVGLVQTEGATQVAAVQAAGASYASLTGATFTGAVSGTDITLSGSMNATNAVLTGELRGPADLIIDPAAVGDNTGQVTIKGDLVVEGSQTTINSATLTVDDINITIADGAADAAAANGAGLTVDGANATMTYTSATDTWDFNKAITGTYTNLHPVVASVSAATSQTIDMTKPMHHVTMTAGTAFSGVSIAAGRTSMMVLDTSTTPHTPTWSSDIKWPDATEPTWADARYWTISFTCLNGVTIFASAQAYTV
jgi:hypothetical protein